MTTKRKPFRRERSEQEEYALMLATRNRLQRRLVDPNLHSIDSAGADESELGHVLRMIQVMDDIGFGAGGGPGGEFGA